MWVGRLLVLAARHQDAPTVCFGQDTDLVCAQMAALNLCFFNIDGAVVWGDSLAMTKRRAWKTRGTMLGGEIAEVEPDDLPWPEAAFDKPTNDAEPTTVEHDAIEQSELGAWEQ
ncbi:Type I restriction-modification system methyltransferase subunit-like protein [Candidatus Halobonum tyrrellensis G22]|uniref:Type I restriction-modification system methyltransferase subunit-like protein n=1 Tax=Candidatus Halobonum tyrrellensis G22 TaxID=1324957 RepID=V4HP77_9EURY|nr:Type I restriction-modification system methyltransferase subunit-like protein [Candidatus Halobonum tyrrellensis G22]